jgi:hypothetical protein
MQREKVVIERRKLRSSAVFEHAPELLGHGIGTLRFAA